MSEERENELSKIPAPFRSIIPHGAELVKEQEEEWKEGQTKTVEYKIATRCARCNYRDTVYNKHDYVKGQAPEERTIMWICNKCDKQNLFRYTLGRKVNV